MKIPKQVKTEFTRREFELIQWCAQVKKEDTEFFLKDSVLKRCKNIYMDYKAKKEEKKRKKEQEKELEKEKLMSEMDLEKEDILRGRYDTITHEKRKLPDLPQSIKDSLKEVPEIEDQEIPKELKDDEDFNKLLEEEFNDRTSS